MLALLDTLGPHALREGHLRESWLQGAVDPTIEDLGLDSLGIMELFLAIENSWGAELRPGDVSASSTLTQFASFYPRSS